ncbi:MAG: carbamate kinase [Flavonifractor plautii]
MGKRIVIALGGNALGNTPYEQLALVTETAKPIVDLIAQGNVIIAHGNGHRSAINLSMATRRGQGHQVDMPFPECGAMSQATSAITSERHRQRLASRGMAKDVATVVTQVLVDEADPAFQHPTKPSAHSTIGDRRPHRRREGLPGRGRRPRLPSGRSLPQAHRRHREEHRQAARDNGTVIHRQRRRHPVVRKDSKLYCTPAVIDRTASAKLAELLDADMLVILTAVEKVAINFGKPDREGS